MEIEFDEDDRATAYHEAGHAAAALVFGMHPHCATIVPDDEGEALGHTQRLYEDLVSLDGSSDGYRQTAIAYYAGAEAQRRVDDDLERIRIGALGDHIEAKGLLASTVMGEEEVREQAVAFVDEHWPLVDRIAVELLAHRTLGPEELDTLHEIYRGGATDQDWLELRDVSERRKSQQP